MVRLLQAWHNKKNYWSVTSSWSFTLFPFEAQCFTSFIWKLFSSSSPVFRLYSMFIILLLDTINPKSKHSFSSKRRFPLPFSRFKSRSLHFDSEANQILRRQLRLSKVELSARTKASRCLSFLSFLHRSSRETSSGYYYKEKPPLIFFWPDYS